MWLIGSQLLLVLVFALKTPCRSARHPQSPPLALPVTSGFIFRDPRGQKGEAWGEGPWHTWTLISASGRWYEDKAQQTQNEGDFLEGAGLREMLQLEAMGNRAPKTQVGFTRALVQRSACVLLAVCSWDWYRRWALKEVCPHLTHSPRAVVNWNIGLNQGRLS